MAQGFAQGFALQTCLLHLVVVCGAMTWGNSSYSSSWRGNNGSKSPWQCKLCSMSNLPKAKACKECGARRAHADSGTDTSRSVHTDGAQQSKNQTSIGQRLQAVNAAVAQMSADVGAQVAPLAGQPGLDNPERKALVDSLVTLETALEALPDSPLVANARASIQADIESTKARITATRPMNERLVLAQQALGRAQQHAAAAAELVKTVNTIHADAVSKVSKLQMEIQTMAAEAVPKQPAAANSLEQLMSGMQRVVTDMETSSVVSPEIISAAKSHMEQLFGNLSALAQQSTQQTSSASANAGGGQHFPVAAATNVVSQHFMQPQPSHMVAVPMQAFPSAMDVGPMVGHTHPGPIGVVAFPGGSPSQMPVSPVPICSPTVMPGPSVYQQLQTAAAKNLQAQMEAVANGATHPNGTGEAA